MVMTETGRTIFDDAQALQAAAVERLDQGDVRDAAEKAWSATKRATDAPVLARTGERTGVSREDGCGSEAVVESSRSRPAGWPEAPILHPPGTHGHRFYMGLCGPLEDTESLIRETAGYIEDTERLAEADPIMARDAARVCAK